MKNSKSSDDDKNQITLLENELSKVYKENELFRNKIKLLESQVKIKDSFSRKIEKKNRIFLEKILIKQAKIIHRYKKRLNELINKINVNMNTIKEEKLEKEEFEKLLAEKCEEIHNNKLIINDLETQLYKLKFENQSLLSELNKKNTLIEEYKKQIEKSNDSYESNNLEINMKSEISFLNNELQNKEKIIIELKKYIKDIIDKSDNYRIKNILLSQKVQRYKQQFDNDTDLIKKLMNELSKFIE